MPRGYSDKYDTVHTFMKRLLEFYVLYPEIDFAIKGFSELTKTKVNTGGYCPFRAPTEDPTVSRIKELYGAMFPILLWNAEWGVVKGISWHLPFLLHVNNWYEDYTILHNNLSNDIIFTDIPFPKDLIISPLQTFFVLRKL